MLIKRHKREPSSKIKEEENLICDGRNKNSGY